MTMTAMMTSTLLLLLLLASPIVSRMDLPNMCRITVDVCAAVKDE